MPIIDHATSSSSGQINLRTNPADVLGPGDQWIVDGLDWSWAFVIYRDAAGFPGYAIGSNGTVWTRKKMTNLGYGTCLVLGDEWKRLKASLYGRRRDHYQVNLGLNNRKHHCKVHRLVLETFIGPRPGLEARHFPYRDPANNHLRNLLWGTTRENAADRIDHGTMQYGEDAPSSKLTLDQVREMRRLRTEGRTYKSLAEEFGIGLTTAWQAINGQRWQWIGEPIRPGYMHKRGYKHKKSDCVKG